MSQDRSIPLFVDLDGTLVKLDTLHQALFLLLRRNPASLLKIPGWWAKGKAYLKDQVMQRVALDAVTLPYHQSFLNWLQQEKANGRKLILATASNYRTADAVAAHLSIFDAILASNEETNLRHNRKLSAIKEMHPEFAYAGNDVADFPIWDAAAEVILVNASPAANKKYAATADHIYLEKKPRWKMFVKAIRCHQWLKNLLIFSPMFLAHQFLNPDSITRSAIAFASFSMAASSIYILNDLFDLSADQHHPRKQNRPFAAGELSIRDGIVLAPALMIMSLVLCLLLPSGFFLVLLTYYMLTTVYSWRLKQIPIADVLILAVLYSMRIFAGAVATGIPASGWFIEFAIFFFLSLALVKRLTELRDLREEATTDDAMRERGYSVGDLPLLLAFGASSGYIAVFVFTLYLGSAKVAELYSRPDLLWIFCPLILYWITRIWYLAWRGNMPDDPLAFAAKDPQTYLVGAIGILTVLYAI